MTAANPSPLRRFRLHLSIAAAAAAAILTVMVGMTGAQAGAAPAAATPTPTAPTPSPGSSTPNTSPFPPSAPTDLSATPVTSTSVTLTWTASTPGCCAIDGYDIDYMQAFDDVVRRQTVGNVTTVTITNGILPTRQYRFSVSARDGLGHHSTSTSITVMIPASDTGDTTPPPAPRSLTAASPANGRVQLSWTPPADTSDVVGYNVYGFDGWFASTLLGTTAGTSFDAPGVSGPLPQYYVRSRDAAGNLSLASNTVRAIAPTSGSPSTNPPSCRVTYTSQAQWTSGFVAGVTIANTGQAPTNGWTLTFTFGGDQRITGSWGAVVSQSGAVVTASNAAWNATIQPGASVSFGIQGIWGASNAAPTAFSLNGAACAT